MGCALCDDVLFCFDGYKGPDADDAGIMFVLNHADVRLQEGCTQDEYLDLFKCTKSGVILERLLSEAGYDYTDVYLTNIFKGVFPYEGKSPLQFSFEGFGVSGYGLSGADLSRKDPPAAYYRNCLQVFEVQADHFSPKRIILFGAQPVRYVLGAARVADVDLCSSEYRGFPVLASLHPSRIWAMRDERKIADHISKAADFLKE